MTDERSATTIATDNGAAGVFRSVGLMADGPVVWGRPVPARGAGVFVIELPATLHHAPVEHTRIGKWLEHVPGLLLDGAHPTTRALAARLEAFWLPSTPTELLSSYGAPITIVSSEIATDQPNLSPAPGLDACRRAC